MTANDYDDAADVLTGEDTDGVIEGEVTVAGQEIPVRTKSPTVADLKALDTRLDEEAEEDVIPDVVDDRLLEPDVSAEEMPFPRLIQLWAGLQKLWSGAEEAEAALEEMDLGNRQ